jgi:hypothetical protein
MVMELEAFVNPDYEFGYWIPGDDMVSPDILSNPVTLTLTGNDTVTAHFKYWPVLGVNNSNNGLNIAVFPTLTNDQLVIDFMGLAEPVESCRIMSVTGQQIADIGALVNGLVEGRKTVSLRELGMSPGMYFVEFRAGANQHVAKVVFSE